MAYHNVLKSIIQEEHDRLQSLCRKYTDKIESLPHGGLSVKQRGNKKYLYLAKRQGKKVKFVYIAPAGSEKACKIREQIDMRKNYEEKLKHAMSDLKEIRKVIGGRKI